MGEPAVELVIVTNEEIIALNRDFTFISINYIGDGLRDAFDPHKVLKKIGEV